MEEKKYYGFSDCHSKKEVKTKEDSEKELVEVKNELSKLNVDLKKYFTVNYGWEVTRLRCVAIGNLVHLSFVAHPSGSWTPNKNYIVLTSKLPDKYKPAYVTYAPGLDMNGDSTDPKSCAYAVEEDGNVHITTGEKTTTGYFACNLTYMTKEGYSE